MRIRICVLCAAIAMVAGCASQPQQAERPPSPAPVASKADLKSNRFAMTQNGQRMSADDFDAWMKARGIRVAKGRPAAKPQGKSKAKPTTVASTAAPSTAGSKQRAKPF